MKTSTFLCNISLLVVDGASGVSSLQSVMAASQTSNRLNLLTPSLAKFFRADLINHVTNWPSEVFEKQVSSLIENDLLKERVEMFLLLGTKMRWRCIHVRRSGVQSNFNWDSVRKESLASRRDPRNNSRAKVSPMTLERVEQIDNTNVYSQTSLSTRTNQKLRRIADTKFIADVLLILSLMEPSRLSFKSCKIVKSKWDTHSSISLRRTFCFRLFLCWLEYCWSFYTFSSDAWRCGTSTNKTIFTYLMDDAR